MKFFLVLTRSSELPDETADKIFSEFGDRYSVELSAERLGLNGFQAGFYSRFSVLGNNRLEEISKEYQIDVNIIPEMGRKKKMFFADMDSTMIGQECIDEVASYAGAEKEVLEITKRAMQGDMDFEASLIERVSLMKGVAESDLNVCYEDRITINAGAKTLISTLKAQNIYTVLISGGFTFFAEKIQERLGFEEAFANKLLFDGNKLTGAVEMPIIGQHTKLEYLQDLCRLRAISTHDVIAIGDGANDVDMIKQAGLGVSYKGKQILRDIANARLDHSDLSAVLYLLGIKEEAFIH